MLRDRRVPADERHGVRLLAIEVRVDARVQFATKSRATAGKNAADAEKRRRAQNQDSLRLIIGRTVQGEQLDLIWAMLGQEVYLKLREERGWSAARYERWVSRAVLALAGDLPDPG
jgi:hypothetical protein